MNENVRKIVANKLREARLACKMDRETVAVELKIDNRTLGHYETGRSEPKLELLVRFSELYNKEISYFFKEVEDENANKPIIDKVIEDLIEEGVLGEDAATEKLDPVSAALLDSALKKYIRSKYNKL